MFNQKKKHLKQKNAHFLKKMVRKRMILIFLCFASVYSILVFNEENVIRSQTTDNINFSEIKAIGTCTGISSVEENTYNIIITGLNPNVHYNIDLNGDNTNEIIDFTGKSTFITTSENNTNITFLDGTAAQIVQVDEYANGVYDAKIIVHEVLCTDADDDGILDFSVGCNRTVEIKERGYIVATVTPYNSTSIYVYALTNITDNALAANTSGLFTNLISGVNAAVDYNVVALNFATKVDAKDFINELTFDPLTGTIVTPASIMATACSTVCGTMAYNIVCRVDDVALTKKVHTTLLNNHFNIGDKVTFDIEIFNQGTAPIFDVVVNDSFPVGYDFLSSDNIENTFAKVPKNILGGGKVTTIIAGPIAPNTSQLIQIVLTISDHANSHNLVNLAEIIEARQTPSGVLIIDEDNDLANHTPPIEGESDNEIANHLTDQDDFDFAIVMLESAFIEPIPTMSEWGLLLFGLLILNMGVWLIQVRLTG